MRVVRKTTARRPAQEDAPDYRLEDQVAFLLRRAYQRSTAIFAERIGPHELTVPQFVALIKIGDLGAVNHNHLARLTAMDPSTVLAILRKLEKSKLIERLDDEADRRRVLIRLTRAGAAIDRDIRRRGLAVTREMLAPLAPREQALLLDLLKRIG